MQQPDIELAFRGTQIGCQLRVVALGIIHEETRMHLKKFRQQHTRRLRHVRAFAALDLREIRLADRVACLALDSLQQFLLRHWAVVATQGAFHLAEVTNFLSDCHIANCNYNIAICNTCQPQYFPYIQRVAALLRDFAGN